MKEIHTTPSGRGRFPFVCLTLACIAVGLAIGVTAFTFLDRNRSAFEPEATLDLHLSVRVHDMAPEPAAVGSVLRVAIAPVISPEASVEQYGDLIRYIADSMGLEPVLLRGKNYSEVNDLIRMRQCDVAMVCTYSSCLSKRASMSGCWLRPK